MGYRSMSVLLLCCLLLGGCTAAQYGPFQQRDGTPGLRWMSIGDWGCDCELQYDIADKMGQIADTFSPHFFALAGDNFYEDGIQGNAQSPRFNQTFESVYTAPSLQQKWYVTAGNHDWRGNVSAEIAYTEFSSRWTFPNFWYNQTFQVPGTNKTLLFLTIDTVIWAGPDGEDGDEHGKPKPRPDLKNQAKDQLKWLEAQLSQTTADWIVAMGHYPIWSVSAHGPTLQLVEEMLPLFQKYGVAAYLCGHDHNTQHMVSEGISFFVTGNGGKNSDSEKHLHAVPKNSLKFYQYDGGFLCLTFADSTYTAEFWAHNSTITYSYTGNNPRANSTNL